MRPLESHEYLEQLLGRGPARQPEAEPLPAATVVYFTANWCAACRRLDLAALEAAFPGLDWLKCDVDANQYSPGFCGVRSIPSFMLFLRGKAVGPFTSSDTGKVAAWLEAQCKL
jgi:thioredoxin-like negative regulator of GroEL